jgi:hypothetical protein
MENKVRTKVEKEGLGHRQGRGRRLQSGFQDLNTLFQSSLPEMCNGQIINGLTKKKKREMCPLINQPRKVTNDGRREGGDTRTA